MPLFQPLHGPPPQVRRRLRRRLLRIAKTIRMRIHQGKPVPVRTGRRRLARNVLEGHPAALGDPGDDPRRAGEQARAVIPGTKLRGHDVADRVAREAVGNELLEVVSDFDLDPPVVDRDDNQKTVVFALGADSRGRRSRTS